MHLWLEWGEPSLDHAWCLTHLIKGTYRAVIISGKVEATQSIAANKSLTQFCTKVPQTTTVHISKAWHMLHSLIAHQGQVICLVADRPAWKTYTPHHWAQLKPTQRSWQCGDSVGWSAWPAATLQIQVYYKIADITQQASMQTEAPALLADVQRLQSMQSHTKLVFSPPQAWLDSAGREPCTNNDQIVT